MEPISVGAEASIFETEFFGLPAVMKQRTPKVYRHPTLDERLRTSRTRKEARLLGEARRSGVRTPVVYDVDVQESIIIMEKIEGKKVREILEQHPSMADDICYDIGRNLAFLHSNRVTHGDLTTSNMILMEDGTLCFFDISLGESNAELESLGVDLQLFHRAFMSAHSRLSDSYQFFLRAYKENYADSALVLQRAEDIRNRGRYT